jgi:hypothetical protein
VISRETPLQLAVTHSAISGARQCKVLQFLLHAGADVNVVDDRRAKNMCLMLPPLQVLHSYIAQPLHAFTRRMRCG